MIIFNSTLIKELITIFLKDTYTVVSLWTKFFNSQQLQFDYLKDARGLHVVELL